MIEEENIDGFLSRLFGLIFHQKIACLVSTHLNICAHLELRKNFLSIHLSNEALCDIGCKTTSTINEDRETEYFIIIFSLDPEISILSNTCSLV